MANETFVVSSELAQELVAKLNSLETFPIKLSALSEHLGMPLDRYFNPEQHDPTFVHDVGGTGINIGGMPVNHGTTEKDAPLYFELRSQYYARYWDKTGSHSPPFARDDPTVDQIQISGRYDQAPPPKPPGDAVRQDDTAYHYLKRYETTKAIEGGYITLFAQELDNRDVNFARWTYAVTTEAGRYLDEAQVEHLESTLIGLIDAAEQGEFETHWTEFEAREKDHKDLGSYYYPLFSVQAVFLTATKGPYFGKHLAAEGKSEHLRLYIYTKREGGLVLRRFAKRLGIESILITKDIPIVSGAGKADAGGDLYYNRIKFDAPPWSFSGVGFYPWLPGEKVATTLSVDTLKLTSFNLGRTVPRA
ncbi:MAG: hypothetical protein JKY65_10525 [Planctomycetes bacterium]|nr:hypothetical protein [Planctomycetota bacterium]